MFDAPDRGGDVVRRGAFGALHPVPLLWQHRGAPVGRIETLGEDSRGLRVVGRIDDARLAGLVAAGAIDGLSFGYRVRASVQGARRELRAVELVEVSLVAQPMQPLARVHALEGGGRSGSDAVARDGDAAIGRRCAGRPRCACLDTRAASDRRNGERA